MRMLSLLAIVLTLGLSLSMADAEAAKRLGGGKSTGMQRQMDTPAKAPTAAPAHSAVAAAPAAAPARSSWMGPLAGLAAGLGLAALASHFGFGEQLANMMMIGLLVMAVLMVIGFFMRKRMAAQGPALSGAGAGPLQYSAQADPQGAPASRPFNLNMPGSSALPGAASPAAVAATAARNIPADFDVPNFVRNAKVNFIRLQAANDAGNLDDIREFTTPEMFAEIKMGIDERAGAKQHTDVVSINADVLEVAEEANRYVVSVRFTGTIREDNANTDPVDEIWHLSKPRDGNSGWLLAGIQQAE